MNFKNTKFIEFAVVFLDLKIVGSWKLFFLISSIHFAAHFAAPWTPRGGYTSGPPPSHLRRAPAYILIIWSYYTVQRKYCTDKYKKIHESLDFDKIEGLVPIRPTLN
jgi:hypothetical protein